MDQGSGEILLSGQDTADELFEIPAEREDELRKFGESKERPDLPQVVVGFAVHQRGDPGALLHLPGQRLRPERSWCEPSGSQRPPACRRPGCTAFAIRRTAGLCALSGCLGWWGAAGGDLVRITRAGRC
jgi:hypothetical protein